MPGSGGGGGPNRNPRAKTKMEKIAELEASLKVSREENRRLKKEMQKKSSSGPNSLSGALAAVGGGGAESEHFPHPSSLSTGGTGVGRRSSTSSQMTMGTTASTDSIDHFGISNNNNAAVNVEKMKDALKALKRVTINQELSLQSLRAKASQRRNELEARDVTIAKLQKQVASLRKATGGGSGSGSAGASSSSAPSNADVIRRLQDGLMDEESKNVELTEKIQAAQARISSLERQLENATGGGGGGSSNSSAASGSGLHPPASPLRMTPVFSRQNASSLAVCLKSAPALAGSSVSGTSAGGGDSQSVASGSTTDLLDVTKLKKELAKKSNRIVQLEYELEETKDELHQVKQQLVRQRHPKPQQQPQSLSSSTHVRSKLQPSKSGSNPTDGFFEADFSTIGGSNQTQHRQNKSSNPFGTSDPFANQMFPNSTSSTQSSDIHNYDDDGTAGGGALLLDNGDDDDDIYSEYNDDNINDDGDDWF